MTAATRFVTHVDLDATATTTRQMSVSARLTAVLADGRSVTLLDDRGWSSSLHGGGADGPAGIRAYASVEEIEETSRVVVGPDEPIDGETQDQMAAAHWSYLAGILRHQGADVTDRDLEHLPHDVVLSDRLRAWLTGVGEGLLPDGDV